MFKSGDDNIRLQKESYFLLDKNTKSVILYIYKNDKIIKIVILSGEH